MLNNSEYTSNAITAAQNHLIEGTNALTAVEAEILYGCIGFTAQVSKLNKAYKIPIASRVVKAAEVIERIQSLANTFVLPNPALLENLTMIEYFGVKDADLVKRVQSETPDKPESIAALKDWVVTKRRLVNNITAFQLFGIKHLSNALKEIESKGSCLLPTLKEQFVSTRANAAKYVNKHFDSPILNLYVKNATGHKFTVSLPGTKPFDGDQFIKWISTYHDNATIRSIYYST